MSFGDHRMVRAALIALPKITSIFSTYFSVYTYLYSETIGHESMKQTSFVDKSTVLMRNKNWKYYHIGILDDVSQPRKQT